MITTERWYLGKWKPGTAISNHLREWQQLSRLPGCRDVCLSCLSFLQGNHWENLYTQKDKISVRQNLATLQSSCFNNTELKPCSSSPGRAGCFLLILPLNYIQRFYLDNSLLSVSCVLLWVVVMCKGKWKEQHMECAQGQTGHSQAAFAVPDLTGRGCLSKETFQSRSYLEKADSFSVCIPKS